MKPPPSFLVAILMSLLASAMAQGEPNPKAINKQNTEVRPPDATNLLQNPGFEKANKTGDGPAQWQMPDGLVWQWTTDPAHLNRGKVLRINTAVLQSQAYAWWPKRYLQKSSFTDAPKPKPVGGNIHGTIGALDGGFYSSDLIPIKKGGAYRIHIDAKGPPAKVFVFGYEKKLPTFFGDEQPLVRQVLRRARGEPELDEKGRPVRYFRRYQYRTWFATSGSDKWKTYTHEKPRHPNSREIIQAVRWIRVMIYPYWPNATYWFDNVRVHEVEPDKDQANQQASEHDLDDGKVIR